MTFQHLTLLRLNNSLRDAFYELHSEACDAGWCRCVAWWVWSFEGWEDRTAEQNRALRDSLFDRDERDGYLLFHGARPVGWCQVVQKDRPPNLATQLNLPPDADAVAIGCLLIHPDHRRAGLAREMLRRVLDDLRDRGVKTVYTYPKSTTDQTPNQHWTGPEDLYQEFGFSLFRDDNTRRVHRLLL